MKTTETFSPTLAKIVLSIASVLGTLGGWAVLSLGAGRAGAGSNPGAPVAMSPPRPERKVVPARHTARERPLRQVDAPPPPPVTFTRSSR